MSDIPDYLLYDERYLDSDPERADRAIVVCCEDTLRKAQQAVEDQGYPCVIVGPGCEDGLLWYPAAMWKKLKGEQALEASGVKPLKVTP